MLYSKNGSIPKTETDGTEGWIEVPDEPVAPDGQEVIWCFPPGWVVRDVMPPVRDGYRWAYYLDAGWVERSEANQTQQIEIDSSTNINTLSSTDISSL